MFTMQCKGILPNVNISMMNYLETEITSSKLDSKPEDVEEKNSLEETTYADSEFSSDEEEPALFENRVLCGYWGVNRFEKHAWADSKRPFTRISRYRDIRDFTEEERQGNLSKRIISTSLSYIEKSPYDLKYAFCKCKLEGKGLIDISALRPYHYIQYLNISHNCLTSLNALSEMPYLQYLDASFNSIENAFDFTPPLYLTTVNYTGNNIVTIPNLTNFWSIVHLNMSNNNIHEIRGLDGLKYLIYLDLSKNKIRMLENLNNSNMDTLLIKNNNICLYRAEAFHKLERLRTVDLSFNKLTSLQFLRQNYMLENVIMTNNEISQFLELFYLKDLRYLKSLNLIDNPIASMSHYKSMCLRTFKKLQYLNEGKVTAEDRVNASTMQDISLLYPPHVKRSQLLLLEQLKRPNTGAHVCPFDQPHPNVIIIIGPPGSGKRDVVMNFVAESSLLQLGVSYTTKPKRKDEKFGIDYYFVDNLKFIDMLKKAEFLSISEFNGYLYGITHQELTKGRNSILVFFSDLETALVLKMAGINPEIVLALPRDEQLHLQWVRDKYSFDQSQELYSNMNDGMFTSTHPVARIYQVDKDNEGEDSDFSNDSSFIIDESDSLEESETSKYSQISNYNDELDDPSKFIFKPSHSQTSLKSCPLDTGSQRLSTSKVASVKLQIEPIEVEYTKKLIYEKSLDENGKESKSLELKKNLTDDSRYKNFYDTGGSLKKYTKSDYENTEYCSNAGFMPEIESKNDNNQSIMKHGTKTVCKDKFGKRVSFNWLNQPDGKISNHSFQRGHLRSVSNTHIFTNLEARFDEIPLLSALSSTKMEVLDKSRSSKTVYTSLSERYDTFKNEKLSSFFKYVINLRKKLLELHYQNPGLFHCVIFTDSPDECISTLKDIAKVLTENMHIVKKWQNGPDSFENHPRYQPIVKNRVQKMNLHQNPFTTIYDEVQID
ncbi:uncharacterized protein LOC130891660 isoform X1 [Diorhabda carinulata]|uniref:uncharacterized protein LOC130891660 isoform X1 n=1 Tax=Diorhabda carinulata TaxID=1163345 RepID=UPI0025A081CF|nr:uncharacterized protein LOC130891660 isoform X1 [Diorhabda carinulata]